MNNRQLDIEVAKALGWTFQDGRQPMPPGATDQPTQWREVPHYSTDLNAAWNLPADDCRLKLRQSTDFADGSPRTVAVYKRVPFKLFVGIAPGHTEQSAATAISRAFLKYEEVEVTKGEDDEE